MLKSLIASFLICSFTTSAFAQKPDKPKLASTPTGKSYLGDNPVSITDNPDYRRTKPLLRRKSGAASAPAASATTQ